MVRHNWVSKDKVFSLTCGGRKLLKELDEIVAAKDTFASELTPEDLSNLVTILGKLT